MDPFEKTAALIIVFVMSVFVSCFSYELGRSTMVDEIIDRNAAHYEWNPKTGARMLKWHEFKEEVKNND